MTLERLPAKMWAGLGLLVLPGLALVGLQIYTATIRAPELARSHDLVTHTLEVINTAQALRNGLGDAERAQRGYLITASSSYLGPYGTGTRDAGRMFARLRALTNDNPEQQARLAVLERLMLVKFEEMRSTLEAHEKRGFNAARAIVLTNAGMEAMRAIGEQLDAVVAAERELLAKRNAAAEDEERSALRNAVTGGALAALAAVLGAAVLLLAFRDQLRAEAARDASERRQRQHQLELAQYQKMESLGQLTGGIAHDFNNLLHVVKNGLTIARQHMQPLHPDAAHYLDMAERNADRASALTQRLLTFARRQVLDPKPLEPNALVAEVTPMLRQAVGDGIEIEAVIAPGAWWVSADASHLTTALLNLAVNARDAMPEGGKLTVEVANAFIDERYAASHSEVKPGQYLMIAVSDTGTGMAKEVTDKAFEPFFTTKEVGRGTGLGLAQVYGFTKQSNGHAKIYSEPGEGTTVKLYLPRLYDAGDIAADRPAHVPALPLPGGDATILLVEDEPDVRQFTAASLSALGYRVIEAGNAAAALRALDADPAIALVFTDIGLPGGMNGRQLADEARRRRPALKVLFTTAYTRNAIIHHGRLDPGVMLLQKPYSQHDLAAKMRDALA